MTLEQALSLLEMDSHDPDLAKQQYKKMSLKHHPDRGGTSKMFEQVKEAYDFVLSYREEDHKFPSNVAQLFKQYYSGSAQTTQPLTDIYYSLSLTLGQLYTGCQQDITIQRFNGTQPEQVSFRINVCPGSYHEQQIRVKEAGHRNSYGVASDLIVVIQENYNGVLERSAPNYQNLTLRPTVDLLDALMGNELHVEHPSGKIISIKYKLASPYDQIVLSGKGMPIYGTQSSFGDLIIKFKVVFPKTIPEHLQSDIHGMLSALRSLRNTKVA